MIKVIGRRVGKVRVTWEVESARANIVEKAQFDTADQRQKVLGLYDQSLKMLAE